MCSQLSCGILHSDRIWHVTFGVFYLRTKQTCTGRVVGCSCWNNPRPRQFECRGFASMAFFAMSCCGHLLNSRSLENPSPHDFTAYHGVTTFKYIYIRVFNIRTGILDYLREGFPWLAWPLEDIGFMEDLWKVYGGFNGRNGKIYGGFMQDLWRMYEGCMEHVWRIYGGCMENFWRIYGWCMEDLWRIYGWFWDDLCLEDLCLEDSWKIYGGVMDDFGGCMEDLWRMYGGFTEDLLNMFGWFMKDLWKDLWRIKIWFMKDSLQIFKGFMEDLWRK